MIQQDLVQASSPIQTQIKSHDSQPAVSLVLVNYNSSSDIIRCLASIYDHLDDPEDLQVVVVDNGSEEPDIDELLENYPTIYYLRSERNLGFGQGCNLGARHALAPMLVFLNPDTVVEEGWLEFLLEPLALDAQIGLVTAKILLLSQPARLNTAGNDIHISGLTLCRGVGFPAEQLSEPTPVSAVSGAAFAIRKELFDKLGGFDPAFFMYMEDTDLSWRARIAGYRCWYAPAARIHHEYHLRFRPNKTYYQERNRYLMLLKNLHWGSLIVLFPVFLLAELVTWGYVLLFAPRQWQDKLRALGWIASHWRLVLEKRRQTQTLRRIPDAQILRCHSSRLDFRQTATGLTLPLAHWLFNPLFFLFKRLALALIWW